VGEQARLPYALKAGDAKTIGGLPSSAFVLAAPSAGSVATPLTESRVTRRHSRQLGRIGHSRLHPLVDLYLQPGQFGVVPDGD
jgi:hypothetical protein